MGETQFFVDSKEHQAYGSTREKLTFALRKCCLLLLFATVVIAATLAHVGLFKKIWNLDVKDSVWMPNQKVSVKYTVSTS